MTNEEMVQDLKQFIQVTVRQEIHQVISALDTKFTGEIRMLDEKIDNLTNVIGQNVSSLESAQQDHERRIRRLEHRAA